MKAEEYEPTDPHQPKGTAAAVAVLAGAMFFSFVGCLLLSVLI